MQKFIESSLALEYSIKDRRRTFSNLLRSLWFPHHVGEVKKKHLKSQLEYMK